MINKNSYFLIFILFIVVLIVVLLFNADLHYDSSDSAATTAAITRRVEQPHYDGQEGIIALVEDEFSDPDVVRTISQTLSFLQYSFNSYGCIDEVDGADIAIFTTPNLTDEDVHNAQEFLRGGGNVIFAVLPPVINEYLMELLEIVEFTPEYMIRGFDIYEGVLLGGMFSANEIGFACAGVRLSDDCRVFASGHGLFGGRNPIIWSTDYSYGTVFAVNAPFMKDAGGAGILTGILAELYEDFIYPIVGTRSFLLNNFPYLDDNVIISSRTSYAFSRDIMWPDLFAIARRTGISYSSLVNEGFLSSADSHAAREFFSRELRKANSGELIYDLQGGTGAAIAETWNADSFTWANDHTVKLPVISSGDTMQELSHFRFISVLSAMGIVIHELDFSAVFSGEVLWNEHSRDVASNFALLSDSSSFLAPVSLMDTSQAVNRFLNIDMGVSRHQNMLSVNLYDPYDETLFILRTQREIDFRRSDFCEIKILEENVYLIRTTESAFSIRFR